MRTIAWFSCGVASALATAFCKNAIPVYCETGAEHPDNARFLADCEKWFERKIVRLRSDKFSDTWDVWRKTRYLAGIDGARCTVELKVMPRLVFQRPDDIHIFGYTADRPDNDRAQRLVKTYPELICKFPLIERGVTKAACLKIIASVGIPLPPMYSLGFHNNNCIPCVKATSAAYWAKIRTYFPIEFDRMAKLSRELGVRLCRIDGERAFIDEIPCTYPTLDPIQPSCDFLCHIAEQELNHASEKL